MSQYINLKVKEVIKETEDAITLVFENPDQGNLDYNPGQFLTLILPVDGDKIRRSYSLCTAVGVDQFPAVTVKKVINGKASNYLLNNVKPGSSIEVMKPMGTFTTQVNPKNKRAIVLIGAGSGITPLMGISKAILNGEPESKVFLVYGNRNEQTIIFKQKLEEMSNRFSGRFFVDYVLSQPSAAWSSHKGRLSQSLIIKMLESFGRLDFSQAEYFICGPDGMMQEAQNALRILNVSEDKIKKESFVSSVSADSTGEVVETSQSATQEVMIIYSGSEYKFVVPKGKTILEAALDLNIDLPYSCQSGMCTACMGKCKSGKVHLDHPDGLSDKEIAQGFVLTCVGTPVSGNVVIEID
jgi:ring-1,2-phenylacetyl-CoA epoxidase subunit PaaE